MAAEARFARQPDRQAHLRSHRGARLPARQKGPREHRALAAGNPRRRRGWQGSERLRPYHRAPRQGQGQVRRRRPGPRRRPGCGEDSGGMGRAERRPPGRLQARLERARAGGSLQAQRRTPRTPAQGRDRVPGFGHHGQPRRQGKNPRHTRATRGRLMRTLLGSRRQQPVGAARCVPSTNARATCAGNDEDSTGLAAGTTPRIAPLAQSPRRLPFANFTGVDSPVVCPTDLVSGRPSALRVTHPTHRRCGCRGSCE